MHNNIVLQNLLFTEDFKIRDRKYYLANIENYNTDYLLSSYYNIYYHLKKKTISWKKIIK